MIAYREGLPPRPERVAALPLNEKGYPIPFFVSYVDGKPDFRVIDATKFIRCVRQKLCWVCGQELGKYHCYVGGPMGALNRISAEPPSHAECAEYAVKACPFILLPKSKRRVANMPEGYAELPGTMLQHNPGVTVIWTTDRPVLLQRIPDEGALFYLDEPTSVRWYTEGRAAWRWECINSIAMGIKDLIKMARESEDPDSELRQIDERILELHKRLPAAI